MDPLDGTVNYLYGFPAWCVSVALQDDEGSAVGVVYDAVRDELFAASRGGGARLNGKRMSVRRRPMREALVATGFGYEREQRVWQAEVVRTVLPRFRDIRRAGAAPARAPVLARRGAAGRLLGAGVGPGTGRPGRRRPGGGRRGGRAAGGAMDWPQQDRRSSRRWSRWYRAPEDLIDGQGALHAAAAWPGTVHQRKVALALLRWP